jgi:flagellar protein FliL
VAKEKEKNANTDTPLKVGLISRIVPILIISILAGGGGYIQGSLVRGDALLTPTKKIIEAAGDPKPAAEGGDVAQQASEEGGVAQSIVRPLAPIISNLGMPSDTWMRLELNILMNSASSSQQEVVAAKAGETIVAFLRTLDLKKIEGPSGFFHFREDLSDLLMTQFPDVVTGVLIGSMVVE